MSQQPRKRRRRRRGGSGSGGSSNEGSGRDQQQRQAQTSQGSQPGDGAGGGGRRKKRRRRRGPGGARPERATFEQLMASYRPQLDQLTLDPDGQDLDEIIGELQSVWGVPQYPQEYRITIKVAEERGGNHRPKAPKQPASTSSSGVQREKASAAPRIGGATGSEASQDAPLRKRRRRRRKGGGSGKPPAGNA